MATRKLEVIIAGDASGAVRAFKATDRAASRTHSTVGGRLSSLSSSFKRLGIAAGVGLAGAGVLAAKFGMDFVKAAEESIKITKQTNAVLESTGGVANVTATQVAKLSDKLSLKAGIDDELIQSGANVLLTFTRVRDEVGRGNDIFTQATTVALDMSVALGTDLQSNVIQVGKALQDPIRGITALRRVGVAFSQGQVEMIKKLVETGDTLGAQKIILQELTTEFGGSAAAQATASAKLAVAWDNLKEELGAKLLPVVESFSNWMVQKGIPLVTAFAGWIESDLVPAFKSVADWVGGHVVPVLERLEDAFSKVKGVTQGNTEATKENSNSWMRWAVVAGAAAAVAATLGVVVAKLAPLFKGVQIAIGLMGVVVTQVFNTILRNLPFAHIITLAFLFRNQLVSVFNWIRDRAVAAWNVIWAGVSSVASKIRNFFQALPSNVAGWLGNAGSALYRKGIDIVMGFLRGIQAAAGNIKNWFKALPGKIWDWIGFGSPPAWAIEGGGHIIGGLLKGMTNKIGTVKSWLKDKFGSLLSGAKNFLIGGPSGIGGLRQPLAGLIQRMISMSGGQIGITSGRRSRAQQEALYAQYLARGKRPPVVARPGTSKHELGLAADLHGPYGLMHRLARQLGLIFPVRGEPWHVQLGPGHSYYEQGAWRTGNEMAQLHAGEMVLPAKLAEGFRQFLGRRPSYRHPVEKAVGPLTAAANTLSAAARELFGHIVHGGRYYEDFSFRGMSRNLAKWNDTISRMFPYNRSNNWSNTWIVADWLRRTFHFGQGGVVPGSVGAPQLTVVHGGEAVFRPDQARWLARGGRGGAVNVTVNVHGSVMTSGQLIAEINKGLDKGHRLGKNGRNR